MHKTVARLLETKGSDVWSIGPDATVYSALELMAEKNVGALLILDGGDLLGIMSERDYARKVVLQGKVSREMPVRDLMTAEVHTVTPDTTTTACMELMTDKHIRHLPVVEEGRVIGLISIGDIVSSVIQEQRFMIEQLEKYITGSTGVS